jgi:hypothetical protein
VSGARLILVAFVVFCDPNLCLWVFDFAGFLVDVVIPGVSVLFVPWRCRVFGPARYREVYPQGLCFFDCNVIRHCDAFIDCCFVEPEPITQEVCPHGLCDFDCNGIRHCDVFIDCCFVEPEPIAQEVYRGFCGEFVVQVWDKIGLTVYCQHLVALIVEMAYTNVCVRDCKSWSFFC